MNEAQSTKKVIVTSPAAIKDNAAWTTNYIDTLGYDYCVIDIIIGATDIAFAALKLQESETSGSGYVDIDGADFDGDTDVAGNAANLPAATDDDTIWSIEVDLRGRKRYLDLSATAGNGTNGTYMAAIATLSRGDAMPNTLAERGCDTILRV